MMPFAAELSRPIIRSYRHTQRPSMKAPPPDHAPPSSAAMPRRRGALLGALAVSLGLLGGCVAFERSPVTERSCDPELPGEWNLRADGIAKRIRIDARCHTEDWPGLREQPVALDLTGFKVGRDRYIVLTPADAERAIGAEQKQLSKTAPAGAVFLVLYRIEGDQANAWLPDSQRALTAIAAGSLRGRKLEDRFALVEGTSQQLRDTLEEHAGLLYDTDKKAMVLQRATAKDTR